MEQLFPVQPEPQHQHSYFLALLELVCGGRIALE